MRVPARSRHGDRAPDDARHNAATKQPPQGAGRDEAASIVQAYIENARRVPMGPCCLITHASVMHLGLTARH